ncbi:tRNA pseudouridine(38/39) synthase [Bienertia sinuspersici]
MSKLMEKEPSEENVELMRGLDNRMHFSTQKRTNEEKGIVLITFEMRRAVYDDEDETTEESKRIWYVSPLRLVLDDINISSLLGWVDFQMTKKVEDGWWELFWCLAWGIWVRRNKWVFEAKKTEVNEVVQRAVSLVGEFDLANVDAGENFVEGDNEIEVAEALGARFALQIAVEAGLSRVVLEVENVKLFSHLKNNTYENSYFGTIVQDVRTLERSCSSVEYSNVGREGNKVAHHLANLSLSFDAMRVWIEEVHPEIFPFVMADANALI